MAKNVLVLKHFESPKEAGIYYRLICLTGSNKGEAYVLVGNRVVIGRSEKADIRLNDNKASREHAEISRTGDSWYVTDLGSQNGVMVNELKVTQKALQEGDKVIIGQSVFKFAKVEVNGKTRVMKERSEEDKPSSGGKKTLIPFLILLVIFLLVMFDDNEKPAVTKVEAPKGFQDASSDYSAAMRKKMATEDKNLKEKLNTIYQRGLREYREKNYFRAIDEFNLALIIAPGDAQAEYYLRKTKEDLDGSIEDFKTRAQRDEDSLKYQSSIISYCSIIRLLFRVPEDPRYKNAETKIKALELKLGIEPGETDCLKKPRTS